MTKTKPGEEGTELPTKPKKKPAAKKVKRLTKLQTVLMKQLHAGGYAEAAKRLNSEGISYKLLDADKNPISWVSPRTIKSLLKRDLIYKGVDGKYYSTKMKETNESQPSAASDDSVKQSDFGFDSKSRNRSRRSS